MCLYHWIKLSKIYIYVGYINCPWPFTLKVILIVPQLVSSLDSRLNSTGELGDTSGAGRYQFFLWMNQNILRWRRIQCIETLITNSQPQGCYWLAEKLHWQEPGVTTKGSVLPAAGANTVIDLGDDGCDMLYACVVKTVDPQAWVPALHLSLEIVEGSCCMLSEGG